MDEVTKAALLKSIEHWKENEEVLVISEARVGAAHCALCGLFNRCGEDDDCEGCPVADATGHLLCGGSPYDATVEALDDWVFGFSEVVTDCSDGYFPTYLAHEFIAHWMGREKFKLAARDERLFLESLLPTENKDD